MSRVKQTIRKGLQLDHKWVRVMLITSIIAVLALVFVPKLLPSHVMMMQSQEVIADTTVAITTEDSVRMIIKSLPQAAPVQIEIVSEPKDFDWKGTITWLIGAVNGLVLVVLNIKNLIIKKRPV